MNNPTLALMAALFLASQPAYCCKEIAAYGMKKRHHADWDLNAVQKRHLDELAELQASLYRKEADRESIANELIHILHWPSLSPPSVAVRAAFVAAQLPLDCPHRSVIEARLSRIAVGSSRAIDIEEAIRETRRFRAKNHLLQLAEGYRDSESERLLLAIERARQEYFPNDSALEKLTRQLHDFGEIDRHVDDFKRELDNYRPRHLVLIRPKTIRFQCADGQCVSPITEEGFSDVVAWQGERPSSGGKLRLSHAPSFFSFTNARLIPPLTLIRERLSEVNYTVVLIGEGTMLESTYREAHQAFENSDARLFFQYELQPDPKTGWTSVNGLGYRLLDIILEDAISDENVEWGR